jgi:hypothetical protein
VYVAWVPKLHKILVITHEEAKERYGCGIWDIIKVDLKKGTKEILAE